MDGDGWGVVDRWMGLGSGCKQQFYDLVKRRHNAAVERRVVARRFRLARALIGGRWTAEGAFAG